MSPEALIQRSQELDGFGIGPVGVPVPDALATDQGAGHPWYHTQTEIAATLNRIEQRRLAAEAAAAASDASSPNAVVAGLRSAVLATRVA